ncbi:hypothetical protein GE09DRAFT_422377 [Coniochaeta sp. 2T2.1]|nr:hypothetical protein GE09DRAFT_422377 [Coniochaeta sp. 2T2.1]
MPPRPASSCSRALQRQLVSPQENIWVSDALLASVFERFFAASHVPRRRASSTPGPLESRRRLGKRRMGVLNAGYTPSALPDWALPDALDLSKWKWEPPTMLSDREEKRQAQLQLAQHWLGQFLVPPSVREAAKQTEPSASPTTQELIDQFQSQVSTEPISDLAQACDDICLQLRDGTGGVGDGESTIESLRTVLNSLDSVRGALITRFGKLSTELLLFTQLYSAVAGRIFTTSSLPLLRASLEQCPDPKLYQALFAQLSDLPASDDMCELFALTIRTIPKQQLHTVVPSIEYVLLKFLRSWSEVPGDGEVGQAQILHISSALSRLDPCEPSVLRTARRFLQRHASPKHCYRAQYAWLCVLARLPRIRSDVMFEAFEKFFYKDHTLPVRMSTTDLCHLLLQHWSSTRTVGKIPQHRKLFEELLSCGTSTGLAGLAYAVFRLDDQWKSRIRELCNILKATGRTDELATSFAELAERELAPRHDYFGRLLRSVAITCDDYRVALRLYNIACKSEGPKRKHPQSQAYWRWHTWRRSVFPVYIEQALLDPTASIADVWKLLRLCQPTDRTAEIAARLAKENANYGNLSKRAAYNRLRECIAIIQKSGQGLPPAVLIAAYRAVTKDLADGNWGRTAWLVWFVELVRKECGPEKAEEYRNMLRSWRQMVGRVKVRENGAAEGGKDPVDEENRAVFKDKTGPMFKEKSRPEFKAENGPTFG